MAEQKASVLVVANRTAGSDELLEALRERAAQGPVKFHLIVPSTGRGVSRVADPTGCGTAEHDLEGALDRLRGAGLDIDGQIGDPTRSPPCRTRPTRAATTRSWSRRCTSTCRGG